jgi:hypothetical protein
MGYVPTPPPNWRHESGMIASTRYIKKFAFIKTQCSDGTEVWLKNYYKKYEVWNSSFLEGEDFHIDFIENITEAEYIIRKLADNL